MGLESLQLALRAAQTSSIATNNIVAGLGKIVDGIGQSFKNAFDDAVEGAKKLANNLLSFYEDTLKPKLEAPIAIFGGNSIMDLLKSAEEFLTSVLLPNAMKVFNFLLDLPSNIEKMFGGLRKDVENVLDKISFSNLMKSIDKLVQYFIDGFQNSILGDIFNDINSAIDKFEKAKNFLGKSPGEISTDVAGKAQNSGLVQHITMNLHGGIGKTSELIDKAGSRLAQSIPLRL